MMTGKNSDDQFNKSGDIPNDAVGNTPAPEVKTTTERKPLDPLEEDVVTKSYATGNVKSDKSQANIPIPEPIFNPPPSIPTVPPPPPPPDEPVNPQLKDLPKKDVENAAAVATEMVIGGYVFLNDLGNSAIKIGDKTVRNLSKKDLLDLRIPMANNQITMGQYINIYNSQGDGVFSVSEDFKEEVRPPLQRIFAKKGFGVSDEQLVLIAFAKDLAFKLPKFQHLMSVRKETLQELKDLTEMYRSGMRPAQNIPPQPPPPHQEPVQQQPVQQPVPPPPQYTPPPQYASRDENVIEAEEIPLEDQPIADPDSNSNTQSVTLYDSNTESKTKRKYTKKSTAKPQNSNPSHRPKGVRNKLK